MLVHETPEQTIPYVLPWTLGIIAHFHQIIAPANVGLRAHESAISKQAHAVNIRNHNPIKGIDKQLHEPTINLIGIEFTKHHDVAQDHQTFNVMGVSRLFDLFNQRIHGIKTCGSLIKTFRNASFMLPKIGGTLLSAFGLVNPSDELTPAHDLSH